MRFAPGGSTMERVARINGSICVRSRALSLVDAAEHAARMVSGDLAGFLCLLALGHVEKHAGRFPCNDAYVVPPHDGVGNAGLMM